MAASRLDNLNLFRPFVVQAEDARFSLSFDEVRLHRNGIEFHSPKAFPVWREMIVGLQSPEQGGTLECNGVVVACDGNRHMGFTVSMLFMDLTPLAQEQLNSLVGAQCF